ncbi:MAG: aminotransferase class I/II-fold pyridoxal phosphate-dependent enzyme [Eubacteriales bacterium]|nr:aminotransferase class I/II-fold pyridoxal phosphate-dependent enzyme [Eubacteriales bacterium]
MLDELLYGYDFEAHYPLHMPGHKRRGGGVHTYDITEIPGFDDLHQPTGPIAELMAGYAALYGAAYTGLSVNGSTAGVLAALFAAKQHGADVLIGRQCHRSVYDATAIHDLRPRFFYPKTDPISGIVTGYDYEALADVLHRHPEIGSMVFTSPTYEGVCVDIVRLREIADETDTLLIVDEAHGAHRIFRTGGTALAQGAHIVIQSLHKTLPALTATAVVHVHADTPQATAAALRTGMRMFQTSSPSYILLSSIARCLRYLKTEGAAADRAHRATLSVLRERFRGLKHIRLFETADYDDYKLVFVTNGTNGTGPELYERLYEAGFTLEMAADTYVIAMTSAADRQACLYAFADCVTAVDASMTAAPLRQLPHQAIQIMTPEIAPSIAVHASQTTVDIADATGRIAAAPVYLYPPGVPIVSYGERYTPAVTACLTAYDSLGLLSTRCVQVLK